MPRPRPLAWLLLLTALARAADYVVLVSEPTAADVGWAKVVARLGTAHRAKVVRFSGTVTSAHATLVAEQPRLVCWVARPTELGPVATTAMHRLARENDADPYEDFRWGVITGRTAEDALRLAAPDRPLVIRTVGASTNFAAECVQQGYWFDEFTAGERWVKDPGGAARRVDGAKDSTADIAARLNEASTDLLITSGHASENDWQPGYRYRNGTFVHREGVITGQALDGSLHPVSSPNPKVYLPIGNCLMGNVTGPDCMALAWMHSAGVLQMVGYVVPTWFGYAGWGMIDYLVEQPGRFTVSEAWLANHHALIWRRDLGSPDAGDRSGLAFDADKTVLYGDPAWDARMAPGPLRWDESLAEVTPGTWEWTITPKAGARTFAPVNTNGSQRGGRPLIAFLPRHAAGWDLLAGAEWKPVLADDFVLVPNPGPEAPLPDKIVIRFKAK